MKGEVEKGTLGEFSTWAVAMLVFFGLPLLLFCFGIGRYADLRYSDSVRAAFGRLEKVQLEVLKRQDPRSYLGDRLRAVWNSMQKKDFTDRKLKRSLDYLRKAFPGILTFHVCDLSGNILHGLSDLPDSRFALKKLVEVADKLARKKQPTSDVERVWPVVKAFIGPRANLDNFGTDQGRLYEVSLPGKNQYFFYATNRTRCLVARVSTNSEFPYSSLRETIARIVRTGRAGDISLGLVSLQGGAEIPPDLALALGEFERTGRGRTILSDRLFCVAPVDSQMRLWVSCPVSFALSIELLRLGTAMLGSVVFGLLVLVSRVILVRKLGFAFSIRWKLVLLFAFACGVPLSLVIFTGWGYLGQLYGTRIQEFHEEMERDLRAFDARFPRIRQNLEIEIGRSLGGKRFETSWEWSELIRTLHDIKRRMKPTFLSVWGNSRKPLWMLENEHDDPGRSPIVSELIQSVFQNLNPRNGAPKIDRLSLISEFGRNGKNLALDLIKGFGKITDVSLAGEEIGTMIFPLEDGSGTVQRLVLAIWRRDDLEEFFLMRNLVAVRRHSPGIRIFAFNHIRDKVIPAIGRFQWEVLRFGEGVEAGKGTVRGTYRGKNEELLLTGIKPKEMKEFSLLGVGSEKGIRAEVEGLRKKMVFFMIISVSISLFLGLVLSRNFLVPIGHLSLGVEALRNRMFQYRIPFSGYDELGHLAGAFNDVMGGLSDLEVARIVQESLFPGEGLSVNGFRLEGLSRSATQLGGDYFEMKALPGGRLLMVIGDVTGHGVPAALVMAMAKAIVEIAVEGNPDPVEILGTANRVLARVLLKKRLMTCFVALLDTETRILSYSNAGHNSPILLRKGQPPSFLHTRGFPLGSRSKSVYERDSVRLEKGDSVFFYTDGLIEPMIPGTQKQIGYEYLIPVLNRFLENPGLDRLPAIVAWQQNLTGGIPQEDDITLMLLTSEPPA